MKTIKEGSMRLLLKEYLYFKSDLSDKSNEFVMRDMKNEARIKKSYIRNVKEIRECLDRNKKLKEIEQQKRKEQEEELLKKQKENVSLKGDLQIDKERKRVLENRQKEASSTKPNVLHINFSISRENMLLSQAERAKGVNYLSEQLMKEIKDMNEKREFHENIKENSLLQKVEQIKFNKLNRGKFDKEEEMKNLIRASTNITDLFPQNKEKEMTDQEKHADAFLKTIDFSSWNYEANKKGVQFESDKRVRFDLSASLPNTGLIQDVNIMKNGDDDLFEEDDESPKNKIKDFDDDIFGDDAINNNKKEESEDDIFGEGNNIKEEEKKDQIGEDVFDEDDPFADEPKTQEKSIKPSQDRVTKTGETEKEEDFKAGDLFSNNGLFKLLENKDKKQEKPLMFGKIKDAETLDSIRRETQGKMKDILKMRKYSPFEFVMKDNELFRMVERLKITDVKTQKVIEKKIFTRLSLYGFYNKKMDSLEKLLALPTKNSARPTDEKIEKIELVVDTEKRRKDMNIAFEENMDKMYDSDVRDIMNAIEIKRKKAYEDKHGLETEEEKIETTKMPQLAEEQSLAETGDIDEVSSIDSDTKEEEKKFKMHDGVMVGQSFIGTTSTDLLQHAK